MTELMQLRVYTRISIPGFTESSTDTQLDHRLRLLNRGKRNLKEQNLDARVNRDSHKYENDNHDQFLYEFFYLCLHTISHRASLKEHMTVPYI